MSEQITFTIDNRAVAAEPGTKLLEVIRKLGIPLPTLCYQPGLKNEVSCGLCTVEREPTELIRACRVVVEPGAVYHTTSPAAVGFRRQVLKLLLARHEPRCHVCDRHGGCELERLFPRLGVTDGVMAGIRALALHDRSAAGLALHGDRCVFCGRCVTLCSRLQGIDALQLDSHLLQVRPRGRLGLDGPPCIGCAQCTLVCPSGALAHATSVPAVEVALMDRDRYCALIMSPTAAAALMNELGIAALPKLVGVFHQLGFDAVLDEAWGADLYHARLARRLVEEPRPVTIINHCPALRRYLAQERPAALDWLAPSDSPARLTASLLRERLAAKVGVVPSQCYLVQLSACAAEKEDLRRNAHLSPRTPDACLTVRECASLLRRLKMDVERIKPRAFAPWRGSRDGMLHGAPGAAGGVLAQLWAARRNEPLQREDYYLPESLDTTLNAPDGPRRLVVRHGAPRCLGAVDAALADDDPTPLLLELYACRGGCLGGGGLHRLPDPPELQRRYQALCYLADAAPARHPQQNPSLLRDFPELFAEDTPA